MAAIIDLLGLKDVAQQTAFLTGALGFLGVLVTGSIAVFTWLSNKQHERRLEKRRRLDRQIDMVFALHAEIAAGLGAVADQQEEDEARYLVADEWPAGPSDRTDFVFETLKADLSVLPQSVIPPDRPLLPAGGAIEPAGGFPRRRRLRAAGASPAQALCRQHPGRTARPADSGGRSARRAGAFHEAARHREPGPQPHRLRRVGGSVRSCVLSFCHDDVDISHQRKHS